jgi:broad specificity phosphatase PhoE
LYLIRHAEPTLTGVFLGGKNDVPLKAAPPSFDLPVEIAYVSPMLRARQTAAGLAAPQIVVEQLREIDFGDWGGLNWDQIEARWPEARSLGRNWFGHDPHGGETWAAFTARVIGALEGILKDPRPKAIVAHGAVNAVLGGHLGQGEPSRFKQKYAQVDRFQA